MEQPPPRGCGSIDDQDPPSHNRESDLGAHLMCAALAPRVGWYDQDDDAGRYSLLLYDLDDHAAEGSWAACDHEPGAAEFQVTPYGERRLWDELSAAYTQWLSLGSPKDDRFGMTIDPSGGHLWLDHPAERSL
jgi:protein-L-isoaspartate(D-aspartate) O-methyltransferase